MSQEPTDPDAEPYGPYDAELPPPIDFDRWLRLSAELLKRDPERRGAILDRHQVPTALWEACNVFWVMNLSDQIADGNMAMADLYAKACVDELARRAAEPKVAPVVPAPQPAQPAGIDETGFMMALPDEPPLPFGARPASAPAVVPSAPIDATVVPIGQTAEVRAVDIPDPLPFAPRKGK